jgi:hypothetical protein
MSRYFFPLVSCLFFLGSCSFFEDKSKSELIPKVDTIVDFNTVDAFPLFPDCKSVPSREKQQICFQIQMSQHIYASLKEYSLNVKDSIIDTVLVKLKINREGKTSLSAIEISEKTSQLLPEFDSIIEVSIRKIPLLKPAIKRDMPVTTEFILPIILKN